jgi:hypothetical protein
MKGGIHIQTDEKAFMKYAVEMGSGHTQFHKFWFMNLKVNGWWVSTDTDSMEMA